MNAVRFHAKAGFEPTVQLRLRDFTQNSRFTVAAETASRTTEPSRLQHIQMSDCVSN